MKTKYTKILIISFGRIDIILTILLLLIFTKTDSCGNDCCNGLVWNQELKSCINCEIGFTGTYCDIPCRYPAYGYLCQKSCNCKEIFCNFSTGCEVGSPTFEPPSPSTTKKSTKTMLSSTTSIQLKTIYCDIGFIGLYCNISCRYPSYGYSCQKSCNCEQKFCNFSIGCEAGSPTIEQPSPSPTEKSTSTMLSSASGESSYSSSMEF
ncbi:scavenger receptor class F member 1-like [Saccostrea echinata]|uniref:scavenger receptor class F member 1-like n=1 Tax=Saccostrea echinata TaxID=191078 RepID=UPI002A815786|nr:scavenger receptor class F member 1-like [Saccostrea echinata]